MKNEVSWEEYLDRFESVLKADIPETPYDNKDYFNYLKLNASRQKRWLKKGEINSGLKEKLRSIHTPMTWIIITEPWCGDAAHSIPFLYLMVQENDKIDLKIVWRDTPPFVIENYLTNGGKSVPKLIARDKDNNDLFTWGPRPGPCQKVYNNLKNRNADFEEMKIELQQWYNKDKGKTLQKEIAELIDTKL